MVKKMRTLFFINMELSPVTPGSPCSQAKAAWTVLPPESWPGRAAGRHLRQGLGGDLLSLPSQQREKRFLELLATLRAWSRLQPQPRQLSELVSLSCSCTTQKHLLFLCCRDTAREHVFPIQMPSLLAGGGCAGQRHGHHQGSSLSCGASSISWHANQLLRPCIHLLGVFPAPFFLSSPLCE